MYKMNYDSLIGNIVLKSDGYSLVECYFSNEKENEEKNIGNVVLEETVQWLDDYFKGNKPLIKDLPIKFKGTEFQLKVWNELLKIPYGSTISYKELGKIIFGEKNLSSQAIGRAVSKNKLLVIVPCHKVIGSRGDLVGYAGGIDRKKYLLDHEK